MNLYQVIIILQQKCTVTVTIHIILYVLIYIVLNIMNECHPGMISYAVSLRYPKVFRNPSNMTSYYEVALEGFRRVGVIAKYGATCCHLGDEKY